VTIAVLAFLSLVPGGVLVSVAQPRTAPGEDPREDILFLQSRGILEGFSARRLSENSALSPEEFILLCARIHSYVRLRVAERNRTEPLDQRMKLHYERRPAGSGVIYGIQPNSWAYPAALYLRWFDEIAPGRVDELMAHRGLGRFQVFAAARIAIERAEAARAASDTDPVLQNQQKEEKEGE